MNHITRLNFWFSSGVVALALVCLVACGRANTAQPQATADGGERQFANIAPATTPEAAHDFSLATLEGDTISLSSLRGKWVLLNFWATWCGPCQREMPYLDKLAQDRDIVVLGVNFNEDQATVTQYLADHPVSFDILMNPDDITLLVYQARGLPRTILISPDGNIAATIVGIINPTQLDAWLDEQHIRHS